MGGGIQDDLQNGDAMRDYDERAADIGEQRCFQECPFCGGMPLHNWLIGREQEER
jgi:hypothetical protein